MVCVVLYNPIYYPYYISAPLLSFFKFQSETKPEMKEQSQLDEGPSISQENLPLPYVLQSSNQSFEKQFYYWIYDGLV